MMVRSRIVVLIGLGLNKDGKAPALKDNCGSIPKDVVSADEVTFELGTVQEMRRTERRSA